jgi:methylmalonyl-CoA mutase N-terminal domain/subunit
MRRLAEEARGEANLLPPIIEAVAAYATVGEIADRLRSAWGVHRELITV